LSGENGFETTFIAPAVESTATVHIVLELRDDGDPPLYAFRRAVVTVSP
jgi:hypothetical protein